jgi:deazaflavin-dependent oxidoreductase (nitroreductase family)
MNEDERRAFNKRNIEEFRATGGTIASFGDAPILLLTTTGAKTGAERVSPMMYLAEEHDGDRVYVFASAAGADANPAWFGNLVAHPDVTVEIGAQRVRARAQALDEPRRSQVFAMQASRYPAFARYQQATSRRIPVVALALERSAATGS